MSADNGVIAYADGSCIGNPGPGGWGVVIISPDGKLREYSGAQPDTTNNRMEITAAIQALRHVSEGQAITIRSDSQYVVKTMTLGWKRDKNPDLWRELETEAVRRKVRWEWVRGHAEDKYNDRADELARNAALGIPTARAKAAQEAVEPSPGKDTDAEVLAALRPMLNPGEDIRRCANCGRAFVASPDLTDALVFCPHIRCQLAERRNKRS